IIVANSPLREGYEVFLKYNAAGLSVEHWINDALMAVFFMMVGLEIKRELLTGQLATWGQRALPGFALFYTSNISFLMLAGAAVTVALLFIMNRAGITRLFPYLLAGGVLWFFMLQSGVHATIAGILLALFIPL
ncbi:Na+/H+ antiporter NhaA, partial [Klebsiella pneumoniae]|uniref:Na+/H+ antiporter NhaA n=1 Tax=Klebsiella pneumoniae TaxID=573 RepID=UPI0015C497C0